jgi:hypothetical protein
MSFVRILLVICALAICSNPARAAQSEVSLTSLAERSGFKRTGRFDEVERLCSAFQNQWPDRIRCVEFGRTPEGRRLLAVIASSPDLLTADSVKDSKRPVVLMQGAIHAGESDGKDAGFLALREMLEGKAARGALDRITFVFVPVLNADGHERFGRWNRPNQVGPEEMGWRTTAQNLNLNRDYTKADGPETQALLRLLNEWDPILYVDLHVTDGADFEHDISYLVAPALAGNEILRPAGNALKEQLLQRMTKYGSLPIDFYPALVKDDDPQSGFAVSVGPPRFSHEYWAMRNRFGVLVETHSWKDYPTRVRATRNSIITMVELAAERGASWLELAHRADDQARTLGGTDVVLSYENTDNVRTLEFKGYAYTREPSAISGALVTKYDNRRPQIWRIPLKDQVRPADRIEAPRGGYIVPAAHAAWMREKLRVHAIEFTEIKQHIASLKAEVFRATKAQLATTSFEGRAPMKLEGEWTKETREVFAGSLFVPIAQPRARLLITLMEPKDQDSLVRWGFFNAAFEQKEYMEAYVAEQVALEMLKSDPLVREEFQRKLSEDADFAKSPTARLEFFYRRHPSWDERLNLYPVIRVDEAIK